MVLCVLPLRVHYLHRWLDTTFCQSGRIITTYRTPTVREGIAPVILTEPR